MQEKLKIVLDTSSIISAFGWKGSERVILDMILDDRFIILMSNDLLEELSAVLSRDKFNFMTDKIELLTSLGACAETVDVKVRLDVIKDDPKDNMVLECAVSGNADYIISGDSHLLRLRNYGSIKISSARDFLDEVI
jgi:uncharacterized protein